MDRFCENYSGGIWQFYTLSNGGAFMAPDADEGDDEKWALFNPMNGNGAEMSAEAAGITVCPHRLQPPRLSHGMRCDDEAPLPAAGLCAYAC